MRYLLLCLVLASCGTRQVAMEQQKARVKELTEVVLRLQNNIQGNWQVKKRGSVQILEPIDPNKPSYFNGQTFGNAKITLKDEEKDSTASLRDASLQDVVISDLHDRKEKSKAKDTESKRPNPWQWLGLTVVGLFGLYLWFNRKR